MSVYSPLAPSSYPAGSEHLYSQETQSVAEDDSCVSALSVLAASGVAELRFLRVDEDAETIHLSGRVRSFYHKQLAQEAIRPVAGRRQVINHVDVSSYV